jgi:thiol-disulfide isomerase/thioredoxin
MSTCRCMCTLVALAGLATVLCGVVAQQGRAQGGGAQAADAKQVKEGGAGEQPVAPEIAAEAKAVLDRVDAFYKQLPGAEVKVKIVMKSPQMGEQENDLAMAAADPNRFVAPLEGADQFKIVSTGETVYMYFGEPLNKYSAKPAPESFAGVIEAISMGQPADARSLMTPFYPVLKLMEGASLASTPGVQKVEYVGKEEIAAAQTEHLRLIGDKADVDVWVRGGEEPWVVRMKPDMAKGVAEMGEMAEQLRANMPEMVMTFDWTARTDFPERTFAFTPPEGSEKVESLRDALNEEAGAPGGEEGQATPHDALLGKAAPELDLPLLGGGKATLAGLKGKVVMLDFWATWCPPCVKGLPAMNALGEKYKDKGVVFYAVNQKEPEKKIRDFLEKQGMTKMAVALDRGSAAKAYGVGGIPQTVLIGKDGTVQVIHVGYMDGMEEEIEEQIEKLLKGEKIAK